VPIARSLRFFAYLGALLTLLALLEATLPHFLRWFNYGFLHFAFYLVVLLTAGHALALVFYLLKYLFFPPPPADSEPTA
jgi:uncharacterized membrane protein